MLEFKNPANFEKKNNHTFKVLVSDGTVIVKKNITVTVDKQNNIEIKGPDKQLVGQTAAEIRNFSGPEPYKGKGIKYADEYINRKEGKKK